MSSIEVPLSHTIVRTAQRWPRGLGLTAAGLVSLAMWLGLIRLAFAFFGA